MSVLDRHEVDVENEDADNLMNKVGDNTCNIIYGPDAVPRGYAYSDYLYGVLKKSAPELVKKKGNFVLRLASVPISHTLLDFVRNTLGSMVPIMVKYRHLGKLLYYKDTNSSIEEPLELTDTGPPMENDPDQNNESLLKHYTIEGYNIKGGKYVDTLLDAHSHFPKALASYISQNDKK